MKLDFSALENALHQLEASVDYLNSALAKKDEGLRMQFRNSAIQCFEFTYELSYKMIRRQLEQIMGIPEELRQMNFADFIRTAAEAGLIPDVKRFLRYRQIRNLTNHAYNSKQAEEVIVILDDFIADTHFLLTQLSKHNEPKSQH